MQLLYIYIYVNCDRIVARYGLVDGERVSDVMDETLRADKFYSVISLSVYV